MHNTRIRTRSTRTGKSYIVYVRMGGKEAPELSAGSFRSIKEAKAREDYVRLEIAKGNDPFQSIHNITPRLPLLSDVGREWLDSRIDASLGTRNTYEYALKDINQWFGRAHLNEITVEKVNRWLQRDLNPNTIRQRLSVLQMILDYADVEPNPARSPKIKLPRRQRELHNPPTSKHVQAILVNVPTKYVLPLQVLEQTGMRPGEVCALTWEDLDYTENRIRVIRGKTHAARRWAVCPDWLMSMLKDQHGEGRVFPNLTVSGMRAAMSNACLKAGIPHYHPHDLRHRYASVKVREGVPLPMIAAQVGHTSKTFTLETYSHVVVEDEE